MITFIESLLEENVSADKNTFFKFSQNLPNERRRFFTLQAAGTIRASLRAILYLCI